VFGTILHRILRSDNVISSVASQSHINPRLTYNADRGQAQAVLVSLR
jgi:hypothetical protein